MAKRTAIIDIGSNSIRLVIYEKTSRFAFHLLNETKSRVRLSEDSYKNNANLQDAAMKRTLSALIEFQSIIKSFKVKKTLCVATSALRDAPNKREFISLVKERANLNIKVISGEKEAYYGGLACANLLSQEDGISVDIGGGSTEFSIIKKRVIKQSISLNLGTVRLKELFFDNQDIDGAIKYIDTILHSSGIEGKHENLVGVGGTFRAVSQVILEQSEHPIDLLHGFEFTPVTLKKYLTEIIHADNSKLKELGIKKDRFDVIRPGSLILLRVINIIETKNVVCSSAGVREGLFLHDLLRNNRFKFPANYEPSVKSLVDRFTINAPQAALREKVVVKIASLMQSKIELTTNELYLMRIAAKLLGVGKNINTVSYQRHSELLIEHGLKYRFKHEEIILIATLVRFHKRKRTHNSYHEHFEDMLPKEEKFKTMSFIIALCEALLTHNPRNIDFDVIFDGKTLHFSGKSLYLAQERVSNLQIPKGIQIAFN